MSKTSTINKKLISLNADVVRFYTVSTGLTAGTFCDLFDTYKPVEGVNPDFILNTANPSNYDKIKYYKFANSSLYERTNVSDYFSAAMGAPVQLHLTQGTHLGINLMWKPHASLKNKTIYSMYKDKVAITVLLKVWGYNKSGGTQLLESFSFDLTSTQLLTTGKSTPFYIQGCYLKDGVYCKAIYVTIDSIGVSAINGFSLDNTTAAKLIGELKAVPVCLALTSSSYHEDNVASEDDYIGDNFPIPPNDFDVKGILLRLHYFKVSLPRQFYIHNQSDTITKPTSSEPLDLPKMFSVPSEQYFEMGALNRNNNFIEKYHTYSGYSNDLAISTNDYDDTVTGSNVAYIPESAYINSAKYEGKNPTYYMFADFMNHCLANSTIELYGISKSNYTRICRTTAYSLMTEGCNVNNINQYDSLRVKLYLPDLWWITKLAPTEDAGTPWGRDMYYSIKLDIGASSIDASSTLPLGEGLYINSKRVFRLFIDGKEVDYYNVD